MTQQHLALGVISLVGQGFAGLAAQLLAAAGHRLQAHVQAVAAQHRGGHGDDGGESQQGREDGDQVGRIDEVIEAHILKLTIRFMMKTPIAIHRQAPPRISWPPVVWNSGVR